MPQPDPFVHADPLLSLLDWKRRVHELYAEVRSATDPREGWLRWREQRDELFRAHPQSPLPKGHRSSFTGLPYYPYDDSARVEAVFETGDDAEQELPASTGAPFAAAKRGRLRFPLYGVECILDLFWITGYGGGAFLAFRDATSGEGTYGGGRYLLDTIKGADLGSHGDRVVLDFNFSYNPSCSYDPSWSCPLPPPGNHLGLRVAAGERMPS